MTQDNTLENKRGFAASKKTDRTRFWEEDNQGFNKKLDFHSFETLRGRSRQLYHDNSYANKSVNSLASHIVGNGIMCDVKYKGKHSKFLQQLWDKWSNSHFISSCNNFNFYSMQKILTLEMIEAGDVFFRRLPACLNNKIKSTFEIQVLESEMIVQDTYFKPSEHSQGIWFNGRGRKIAYTLRENYDTQNTFTVNAEDMGMLMRHERIGQSRGIPWITPAIIDLNLLNEYVNSELIRRRVASGFAGFMCDINGANANQGLDDLSDSLDTKPINHEYIQSGTIKDLPAGKTIVFSKPPVVQGFREFNVEILKKIAAGIGVPYELLANDFADINFSSARAGLNEFFKQLEFYQEQILIAHFCEKVFQWWAEDVEFFYPKYKADSIEAIWTLPRKPVIDPLKEAKANEILIKENLKTADEIRREDGYPDNYKIKNKNSEKKEGENKDVNKKRGKKA